MKKLALFLLLCASPFCATGQTLIKEINGNGSLKICSYSDDNEKYFYILCEDRKSIDIYDVEFNLIKNFVLDEEIYESNLGGVTKGFFNKKGKFDIIITSYNESNIYDESCNLLYKFQGRLELDFEACNIARLLPEKGYVFIRNGSITRVYKIDATSAIESNVASQNNAYPSPAKDIINIGYNIAGFALGTLVITDTSGKAVETILVSPSANTASVDITGYPVGVYLYAIGEQSGKFIKK
jgi:hypothetical protein